MWRRRRQRRQAAVAAREDGVRDRAFAIVRAAGAPFVAAGCAQLREVPDPRHGADDPWIELTPSAAGAARIAVNPDPWILSLCVGPKGNLHEIGVAGDDSSWEVELRACLDAVVRGRYVERIDPRPMGDHLVMTFESAEARDDDLVVTHQSLGLGRGAYGPYGERRFAPYAP